jgi:hypothetical protein
MGSDILTYIPSLIKIDSDIQEGDCIDIKMARKAVSKLRY